MSNISQGEQLSSAEVAIVNALAALAITPANQAIAKTGATTFSNVSTGTGGGGFTILLPTETPDGNQTVFTFSAATSQPTFIVSDNAMMRATGKRAAAINWTWNNATKQATMTIPPSDDIVAIQ